MDILFDYLTFTSKYHSLGQLVENMGLQGIQWQQGRAYNGWLQCDYSNGIRLLSGGREDVCIDVSGVGCRMIETCNDNAFDWLSWFDFLKKEDGMNVSRLDVACDEKEGILNHRTLCSSTEKRRFVSRARKKIWINGDEEEVLWGSKSSDTRLRIYNKALERKTEGHWMRAEFQFRDEAADSFIFNLLDYGDIGRTYSGVLNNYLRYTTKAPIPGQRNQSRLNTASWWLRFTGTAEKISNVKVGGMEYNFDSLERFLSEQCASSMKAYIRACGGDVTALLRLAQEAQLTKKQEDMLQAFELDRNRTLFGEEDQDQKWYMTERGTTI